MSHPINRGAADRRRTILTLTPVNCNNADRNLYKPLYHKSIQWLARTRLMSKASRPLRGLPASYSTGARGPSTAGGGWGGGGRKRARHNADHIYPVPKLMNGSIPALPQYASVSWCLMM